MKVPFLLKKILSKIFDFSLDSELIYYLCTSEALPSPLSLEDEEFYARELLLIGNEFEQRRENAKTKLIEHNLRLVVYISKKFENTGESIEDLISVGSIGLIKAINNFNIDKNIKLATFASRCIENEILMHLRKTVKIKNEISLDEPLNIDSDGNELVLADVISMDNDSVTKNLETSCEQKILLELVNKLNKREQEIINLRFGLNNQDEKTQKEVADMLGISQSYISRIEKKIISKLKKEIIKVI
ncbi:MAG: sigma-70 family RNA polymerase sigma factor [Clostridiales bacterium]|nr:sigma-70 family RNA polymerase sigma factor [Clostridiales bacterium]